MRTSPHWRAVEADSRAERGLGVSPWLWVRAAAWRDAYAYATADAAPSLTGAADAYALAYDAIADADAYADACAKADARAYADAEVES